MRYFLLLSIIIVAAVMWICASCCRGDEIDWMSYTNEQYADAIYKAEGGAKAKVPYGILSVKVSGIAEARRVCINTVRNNRVRFAQQKKYTDFVEFLGNRYCPVDAHRLNRYWVGNVKKFLRRNNAKTC